MRCHPGGKAGKRRLLLLRPAFALGNLPSDLCVAESRKGCFRAPVLFGQCLSSRQCVFCLSSPSALASLAWKGNELTICPHGLTRGMVF
ncbi:hypothetical protein GGS23DRAFT_550577 [Durotheca rogersii]|uniref:uncharacterized protein n=1 Tax=Durotheca rogersii TaxID=419775 RepID=UPI00221F0136|nr:uncharacterized protein GGS23DRAFT_550577 [Durotheca rogersii]KAI5866423.1 hypothetical protein GGS23DRAFT_550577 [Durotheca rogersii]